MKRKLFFLAALLLATVMNLHADTANIDLTSGYVTSGKSLVTYNLDDNISIVIACSKLYISNDGHSGTSFEPAGSITVKAADGCTITAVKLEFIPMHCPSWDLCGFVPGVSTPGITNSSQYSNYSGSATQVVWTFNKMEDYCTLSNASVTYTKPEPITYIAPVYNSTGDPQSGILQWDTLSCSSYTVVADASSQVTWNAGWYVVKGNVTLSKGAVCNGAVHLILADGAMLTTTGENSKDFSSPAFAGIQVSGSSNSLTIYGQAGQSGILIAKGGVNAEETDYAAAGIGGGLSTGEDDCSGSNITINGGIITATGGKVSGAGIGGGYSFSDAFGKNITINGGIITATGSYSSAGIGGGYSENTDGSGSYITINGGTVTATGGYAAASIGGGDKGSGSYITINGGKIEAKAKSDSYYGAGIGGGMGAHGSYITINGGEVTATGGSNGAGIGGGSEGRKGSNITITGGKVTTTGGGNGGAGIGGGREGIGSNITITGGEVTATGGYVDEKYQGDGIGNGLACSTPASNIFVDPALILKADKTNPPTTVIAHASITTDVASDLAGKQYVTVAPPAGPDTSDYLYFVSLKDNGSVQLNKAGSKFANLTATFEYSTDRTNWTEYTWPDNNGKGGYAIALPNAGDTVFLRAKGTDGKNESVNIANNAYFTFKFGANDSIAAGGNMMSLYDASCEQKTMTENGFYYIFAYAKGLVSAPKLPATTLAKYCYYYMFYQCSALTTAPDTLPATTLAESCCSYMFTACTSLTKAPALPATIVEKHCYQTMFQGCTALTTAPALPATQLSDNCYSSMFADCSGLLTAPELPADTLKMSCYGSMFQGCTALTQAPELKATALAISCYSYMFYKCTSLATAPELPADTLVSSCYSNMFAGCTSLTKAPALPAAKPTNNCYQEMFAGCTALTQAPELKPTKLASSCFNGMFKNCTNLVIDTCDNDAQCKGALLIVPTVSYEPSNWNKDMFTGCKGDAAYTAQKGIKAGAHYCIKEYKEPDMHDMLYFVSLKDNGSVHLDKVAVSSLKLAELTATFEYSTDRIYWTECAWNKYSMSVARGDTITLQNAGDTIFFRAKGTDGKNATMSTSGQSYYHFCFGATDSIAAGGNIMSLYDASCEQVTMTEYGLFQIFGSDTQLISAPKFPATTLATNCYKQMFKGCTALTQAPELKATTLANACYAFMFDECTKLQVDTMSASCNGAALVVPTTGANYWNLNMFRNCHGAYANNIQLGGHYCIKEYVEPGPGTDVENVDDNAKDGLQSNIQSQKCIENGQLIILHNGIRYSTQGQIIK